VAEAVRRWAVTLAAVAGVALTARLGVWQLDRAAQKQALQNAIVERGRLPPLDERGLARDERQAQAQHYRPVRLQGHWQPRSTVYLDNRQMRGLPGFFVLTPLELAPGDAVLVQRGWVPRDPRDRTRLPTIPTPPGPVTVLGRIAPPPSRLFDFGGAAAGPIRQNLDLAAFAGETGLALRPLSVQQLDDPSVPAPDGLLRDWPLPAVDIAKHHGYAFQWFALSALIAGLYAWFRLLRPRLVRR
jgi:surfeit locus 1 family protein